jgi:uncharacterized protein YhdP
VIREAAVSILFGAAIGLVLALTIGPVAGLVGFAVFACLNEAWSR